MGLAMTYLDHAVVLYLVRIPLQLGLAQRYLLKGPPSLVVFMTMTLTWQSTVHSTAALVSFWCVHAYHISKAGHHHSHTGNADLCCGCCGPQKSSAGKQRKQHP